MKSAPTHTPRPTRDLAALLLLALAFRVFFLLAMPRVLDNADAIHYAETARTFQGLMGLGEAGEKGVQSLDPKIPLLYPLLSAVASVFTPDIEWACRLVSLMASVLLIVPVYSLAFGMHGRRSAIFVSVIICFWPWLADYGCRVSTEATAVLCWFAGVWALWLALRRGTAWACWVAPLAFAALHFTRAEGTAILLAAPVLGFLFLRGDTPLRRWATPYVIVTACALVLSMLYNRAVTGAANPNVRVGYIVDEFDWLRFGQTALATVHDVFPIMLGPVLFLFLGVGLLQPREQTRDLRREFFLLGLCAVQWGVSLFVLSPAPRYLMAPLIALSIWSARGMDLTMIEAAKAGYGRLVRALPMAAIVASMLVSSAATLGAEHLGRRPRQPREYKAAGLWMRDNLEPGLIFTRKPQVGFYADMPSTGPASDDDLAGALDRAREAGARYVVVDERYASQTAPGLVSLLNPAQAPPEALSHLKTFDLYPDARVVIYGLREVTGVE